MAAAHLKTSRQWKAAGYVHILQINYNLSDPRLEELLLRSVQEL